MVGISHHRICKIGSSYAVFLPIGWIRFHGLESGDAVEIISDRTIKITPIKGGN